ncbi:MAG: TSUP family transporter [Rhodobacterales bacterium]|nr:TSUP family transporter [Rhodobacterales bacterium]
MEMLLAALVMLTAQLVKATTGFGAGLVAIPALSILWGTADAMAVLACTETVAGVGLLAGVRNDLNPKLVLLSVGLLLPAMWVGTGLQLVLSVESVRGVLAVLVFVFGLQMVWNPVVHGKGRGEPLPKAAYTTGAIASVAGGILGGLVGAFGPPLVVWCRRWLDDAHMRAHLIAVFFPTSVVLPLMLWMRGALSEHVPFRFGLMLIPMGVGAWLGTRLAPLLTPAQFGRAVGVLLLACAGLLVHAVIP